MGDSGIRQIQTPARIVLICPDCGHENSELADVLRSVGTYYCRGEACDYLFDLMPSRAGDLGRNLIEAVKRFYAAFYAVRVR